MTRTIIKNGTIVNTEREFNGDLIIEGEKIAGLALDAQPGPDDRVIDAQGMYVLPGVVDAHTHIQLNTGIYQTADTWQIGTQAAAAGGVTTVIDFATQFRGWSVDRALEHRLAEAEPALIDYGLHCMITELPYEREGQMLKRLNELGVVSFKIFTTYRPNYYMEDASIYRLMAHAWQHGVVMAHAENDSIVTEATARLVEEGKTGWRWHPVGRPEIAEVEAVNRLILLAEQLQTPLYIVHCTSNDTIHLIHRHRQRSALPVYCETCPQYLLLEAGLYEGDHPEHYILQPPLRYWEVYKDQRSDLWSWLERGWRGLEESVIDVISTDHCDYSLAQKTAVADFTKTPGGLPGVETMLPLIYTYGVVDKRVEFTMCDLVEKLSTNPARIFGRWPQKGVLEVGSDADVVLFDPAGEDTLSHSKLHYVAGYSPYEGMKVNGRVHMTISRGEVIYQNGEITAKAGRGRFVPGKM